MTERIELLPVDRVEITTLYENLVDLTAPGQEQVERLRSKADNWVASHLLGGDGPRVPLVGGHGLSMLVRVTRNGITRGVLFDTGGSPDGLVHNLDCLELNPREWNCIVLSHGHWDHTLGLAGLHRRMGRLNVPLTLHPDAYLTRLTVDQQGKRGDPIPGPSRQALLDAG
ncbi:MAG: MBL fold metallo-hydrolase, partial [Chloroflexi bacterium]|nr:MBL fold metallo-hydrolase [Chloroflexota bacterium]